MNSDTLLLSAAGLLTGFVSALLAGVLIVNSGVIHGIEKSSPEVRSQTYSYSFV